MRTWQYEKLDLERWLDEAEYQRWENEMNIIVTVDMKLVLYKSNQPMGFERRAL